MLIVSKMLSTRCNWQKLFSYGEVICFVSAWAIGLVIAMQEQRPDPDRVATGTFAAASDVFGIQATLSQHRNAR
jgi:cation transporter-like permease